jgi:hypothetical protein
MNFACIFWISPLMVARCFSLRLLIEIHAAEKQAGAVAQSAAASFEAILTPDQRGRLQFVRQAAQVEPALPAFKAVGLLP